MTAHTHFSLKKIKKQAQLWQDKAAHVIRDLVVKIRSNKYLTAASIGVVAILLISSSLLVYGAVTSNNPLQFEIKKDYTNPKTGEVSHLVCKNNNDCQSQIDAINQKARLEWNQELDVLRSELKSIEVTYQKEASDAQIEVNNIQHSIDELQAKKDTPEYTTTTTVIPTPADYVGTPEKLANDQIEGAVGAAAICMAHNPDTCTSDQKALYQKYGSQSPNVIGYRDYVASHTKITKTVDEVKFNKALAPLQDALTKSQQKKTDVDTKYTTQKNDKNEQIKVIEDNLAKL